MKIAILGAGLSGLSVAWHLLEKGCGEIVLYDSKGVGGGASGIATGLMHPYTGEQGRRSLFASEGMLASKRLIAEAERKCKEKLILHQGILRYVQNEAQKHMFLSHCQTYGDVKPFDDRSFWIESGITVDCPLYLKALWQMIAARGAKFERVEIADLTFFHSFDCLIVAAGAGMKRFPELKGLNSSILKGQVLTCRVPKEVSLPPTTTLCKGYLAMARDNNFCLIGSTYEREDLSEIPNPNMAKDLLFNKIHFFFPQVEQLSIVECKAALRLSRIGHYFPFVGRVKDKMWILAGLGSRGLLYHAYLGELLAEAIVDRNNLKNPFVVMESYS